RKNSDYASRHFEKLGRRAATLEVARLEAAKLPGRNDREGWRRLREELRAKFAAGPRTAGFANGAARRARIGARLCWADHLPAVMVEGFCPECKRALVPWMGDQAALQIPETGITVWMHVQCVGAFVVVSRSGRARNSTA